MIKKTVFYVASALFCAAVFAPPVSLADGHCPYSGKGGEKSFWSRITGGDGKGEKRGCHKDKHAKHAHGKYGHGKCGHGGRGAGAFWWRSGDMAERLRLNDAQVERLDEITASHYEKMASAYDAAFEAKHRFKKVMRNPDSSADEIKAAAERKYAAMTEKKRARLEMRLAMRGVLTGEQIRDLSVFKRKGRKGCGKHGR